MNTNTNIPVQEDEMATIRNIFERVANTITQASELARTVQQLKEEVDNLRQEVDHIREQNRALDEALASTRQQRDDLQRQVNDLTNQLREVTADRDNGWQKHDALAQRIEQMNDWNARTVAEHKDAMEKIKAELDHVYSDNSRLDGELKTANSRLAKAREFMEHLQSAVAEPKAEGPTVSTEATPSPEAVQQVTEPVQHQEPAPQPEHDTAGNVVGWR